ncbi:photosystem II stability/assembly factor HCF136, chloroplastic isoform X2 [Elaeis guineensis]|uniref:photosystem II stability/assembly factor HCF136, chloroplastic isoform X2 n=1 Tax=Elaeis guineensis var. tenera TaxID=51953 RepID=UPI003C6CF4F5
MLWYEGVPMSSWNGTSHRLVLSRIFSQNSKTWTDIVKIEFKGYEDLHSCALSQFYFNIALSHIDISNQCINMLLGVLITLSLPKRTVCSGISGVSYHTGTFNTVNCSPYGNYVAFSSRGNFYLTWEAGQPYWQPHNRAVARRIQYMGWRVDGGLWLLVHGGGLYLSKCTRVCLRGDLLYVQISSFCIYLAILYNSLLLPTY